MRNTIRLLAPALLLGFVHDRPDAKPMSDEGIPEPCFYKLGAKPTTYKPCPNHPPRRGSKRKRQWR